MLKHKVGFLSSKQGKIPRSQTSVPDNQVISKPPGSECLLSELNIDDKESFVPLLHASRVFDKQL